MLNVSCNLVSQVLFVFVVGGAIGLAGVRELKHRQTAAYYDVLLGRHTSGKKSLTNGGIIADNALLDLPCPKAKRQRHIPSGHGMHHLSMALALKNREEGDPEDGEDASVSGSELRAKVDSERSHKWGGVFQFTHVVRVVKKGVHKGNRFYQWEVRCPFHNDPDTPDTACTKTCTYHGSAERDEVARQLREWCMEGRHVNCRRKPRGDAHQFVKLRPADELDDDELEAQLKAAKHEASWIIGGAAHGKAKKPKAKAKPKAAKAKSKSKAKKASPVIQMMTAVIQMMTAVTRRKYHLVPAAVVLIHDFETESEQNNQSLQIQAMLVDPGSLQ